MATSVLDHLDRPRSFWTSGVGEASDVVVSSRVRLARNLRDMPFPEHLTAQQAGDVLERVAQVAKELGPRWEFVRLQELSPNDREVLVEKHLISPQQARTATATALLVTDDESQAVMVNEEDHLRLQSLVPGLQPEAAWQGATATDDRFEKYLDFAFDRQLGYLTAWPTNVGTGVRVSVMVHLGGLVMTGLAPQLVATLSQLGVTVRGLYGEGTEALGQLFQISNQLTLGQTEDDIVDGLHRVALQVVREERRARERLAKDNLLQLQDRIGRALGLLRHARLVPAEEAMQLLSDIRLGVEMKLTKGLDLATINELLLVSLPGYLERKAGQSLDRQSRRALRATLIREYLEERG